MPVNGVPCVARSRFSPAIFAIEIERCRGCGGKLRMIASIEDPALIERILAHRKSGAEHEHEHAPFNSRAPPPQSPLF